MELPSIQVNQNQVSLCSDLFNAFAVSSVEEKRDSEINKSQHDESQINKTEAYAEPSDRQSF